MPVKNEVNVRFDVGVLLLVLFLVIGAGLALLIVRSTHHPQLQQDYSGAGNVLSPKPAVTGPLSFDVGFAPIVHAALPAVVNISASKIVHVPGSGPSFFFNDPFFRRFFGELFREAPAVPREQRERSLGSGVLVRSDGLILTNAHVVDVAADVRVVLADKREFRAKVTGTDAKADIAILKIEATGLPVLPLGDSSQLQVGNFVLAIGDPFGIGETVTLGIVSATGRGHLDIEDYEDFIQTDAAINPGNSGGALIDVHGNLVGINTAILTGMGGGNQGIGFAVPINMARYVLEQILHHGKVIRAYLGAEIQDVTAGIAQAFHTKSVTGALLAQVEPGGPAQKAGLKSGDIILAVDGTEVTDANMLRLRVSQAQPNTLIHLHILRDGHELNLPVKLGELPEKLAAQSPLAPSTGVLSSIQVQELTPQLRSELGAPQNATGVVITGVQPGSAAAEVGLRPGDIIQEVDRHPIRSVPEFLSAARAATDSALLLIKRHGMNLFVMVQR